MTYKVLLFDSSEKLENETKFLPYLVGCCLVGGLLVGWVGVLIPAVSYFLENGHITFVS